MKRLVLTILLVVGLAAASAHAQRTIRVPGEYPTIQAGIDVAENGDTVLVANGVYKGEGNKNLDFGGKLITVRSENGPDNCVIDCEDEGRGFFFHNAETEASVLQGFTVKNGKVERGGGILCDNSSPTITNCTIADNCAWSSRLAYGGGIYCNNSNLRITKCTIAGNTAEGEEDPVQGGSAWGGGVYCSNSSPTITECTITGNGAYGGDAMEELMDGGYANGGGLFHTGSDRPTITNTTIMENSAVGGKSAGPPGFPGEGHGGGMYNATSSPTLTNCTFSRNSVNDEGDEGGGMYNFNSSSLTLTDCAFSENSAGNRGGGMYNYGGSPTLNNCTFTGNSAGGGGGMFNATSSPTLTNCTFSRNSAHNEGGEGGGMYNFSSSSPTLTNCTFSGNSAVGNGGGMHNRSYGRPTLTNCTFSGNSAHNEGGGMYNKYRSNPTLTNCTFSGNSASLHGGGMCNREDSRPTLANCTFSGNSAVRDGGGMYNVVGCSPTLSNCTFSGNSADENGGGMYNCSSTSNPTLTNCVLWGDTPDEIDGPGNPVVTFSDVQGGWPGEGNIDEDPLFVQGPLGEFYLSQIAAGQPDDSPCVDAGSDTAKNLGLDEYTTRTDEVGDKGIVDTGYHHPISKCGKIKRLKANCKGKPAKFKIKATIKSDLPEGTELTLLLDGGDAKVVTIKSNGKAKTKWKKVAPGEHEVCIEQCPDICDDATCSE